MKRHLAALLCAFALLVMPASAAVKDWSTTAGSNTTLGGLSVQGSAQANTIDDIVRELMAQLATFFIDANFQLDSTDAGATVAPTAKLYRNSASPAASDIAGRLLFQGEDSAGNTEDYAEIDQQINDPTSTSEDATIRLRAKAAGTMTTVATASGANGLTVSTAFTSLGIDDNATGERVQIADTLLTVGQSTSASGYVIDRFVNDGFLTIKGGTNAANGAQLTLVGDTNATQAGDYEFVTGSSIAYRYDSSATSHLFTGSAVAPSSNDGAPLGTSSLKWSDLFLASGGVINWDAGDVTITHSANKLNFAGGSYAIDGATRFGQDTTDIPGAGNNTAGASILADGRTFFSLNTGNSVWNRTSDGTIVGFNSGGTPQGSISVSGATVSYNAFFGSHWSQLADGSQPDILRGTIVETIDQITEFEDGPRERLPRFKISDTPGAKAVYGVFAWWAEEEHGKAHIGALGAYFIRIAPGETVQRGDLIESNGDGCGRVQADDIMRSSTVAKVTSAIPVAENDNDPDGCYLVPATLHAG